MTKDCLEHYGGNDKENTVQQKCYICVRVGTSCAILFSGLEICMCSEKTLRFRTSTWIKTDKMFLIYIVKLKIDSTSNR